MPCWKIRAILELDWCNPIRKLFISVLFVVLSPCFIFVFGVEILFFACSATFLIIPELIQKTLLKQSPAIELIKNVQLCTGWFFDGIFTPGLQKSNVGSYVSHIIESGCHFDTQILEYYCAPQKLLIASRTKTIK